MMGVCPASMRAEEIVDPINPAPPVTKIFIFYLLLNYSTASDIVKIIHRLLAKIVLC
jgi:hypothetical protein